MNLRDEEIKHKLFETLVREHHKRALGFAHSLVSNSNDAEDLTQEAFVTAYRKIEEFDVSADFGSWVRGIIRMKYFEHIRKRKDIPMDDKIIELIDNQHQKWDMAEIDEKGDVFTHLKGCIGKLEDLSGSMLKMFYYEKKKCAEIAQAINLNEATVRKRLERIRSSLKMCLDENIGQGAPS